MIAAVKTAPTKIAYEQIERRASIAEADFSRLYKARNQPLVITDAGRNWRALAAWNFDFFRSKYGATEVTCARYDGQWYQGANTRQMLLGDFIDGILSRDWKSFPYYIRDYYSLFEQHPELLADCPIPAYFFDWFGRAPAFMRRPGPRLFVGPAGAITPFHSDIWGTHAWMTQIVGRKRWILISPDQARCLGPRINKPGGLPRYAIDPADPDFARTPEFGDAHPVEATIGAGEAIFVPGGWFHHVVSIDPTVSLTGNFMGPGCFWPVLPNAVNDLVIKRVAAVFQRA